VTRTARSYSEPGRLNRMSLRFLSIIGLMLAGVLVAHSHAAAQARPPETSSMSSSQAEAARRMDERIARQERAAKRALTGICDECSGRRPSGHHNRGRRTSVGEDGLPYQRGEIEY
jgi:hypothetical protein